jgi:hypothetical protein
MSSLIKYSVNTEQSTPVLKIMHRKDQKISCNYLSSDISALTNQEVYHTPIVTYLCVAQFHQICIKIEHSSLSFMCSEILDNDFHLCTHFN